MNRSKFVIKTIQSTFVGLLVLATFLIVGLFSLEAIINTLYPPLPICPSSPVDYPCYRSGPMLDLGQNFGNYIFGIIALYLISICMAGFASGIYANISRLRIKAEDSASYVWQSLISGSIIGSLSPLILFIFWSNKADSIGEMFIGFILSLPVALILGLPATISGFIGYKFNVYTRDLVSKPKNVVINLVITSLISLVIFTALRVSFDPLIGVKCEYFPVQGILLDVCTESEIVFVIILSVSTFVSGWWTVRADRRFEYGIISGLVVGILGPLLAAYFYNQNTPLLASFFYGAWGGLCGLCGSVCKRRSNYSWRFDIATVRTIGVTGVCLVGIWAIVIGLKPCGYLDTLLNFSGCVRTLNGHETDVRWVAITPDGALLASSATDKRVKVWQLDNGTLLNTLTIGNEIYSLNFSADGTILAVGLADGNVQIWDIENETLLHQIKNGSWLVDMAFSPDGAILAVATTDRIISTKLWRVDDGSLLQNLEKSQNDNNSSIHSLAFSPDGKMLAVGEGGRIRLWQVEGCYQSSEECGALIGLIDAPGGVVDSLVFNLQGDRLAAGSEDKTRIWQIEDCLSMQKCGKLLHTFQSKPFGISDVAFSQNSEFLAENSGNRQIRVWRLSNDKLLQDYDRMPGRTHNLLFTSDNSILTTAPVGNTVQVWMLDSE